jgi:hypothetical protein
LLCISQPKYWFLWEVEVMDKPDAKLIKKIGTLNTFANYGLAEG